MKPVELAKGDPCPACQGELRPVPVPSDEQLAAAADRENPQPLPPGFDTAPKAQRDDLGALYKCADCGYRARFAAAPAKGSTKAAAK